MIASVTGTLAFLAALLTGTATGLVHAVAGQLAFVCFGVAAVLLTWALPRPRSRLLPASALLCAAALAFAVAVTALGRFELFGLAERVLLPACLAWSVLMSTR